MLHDLDGPQGSIVNNMLSWRTLGRSASLVRVGTYCYHLATTCFFSYRGTNALAGQHSPWLFYKDLILTTWLSQNYRILDLAKARCHLSQVLGTSCLGHSWKKNTDVHRILGKWRVGRALKDCSTILHDVVPKGNKSPSVYRSHPQPSVPMVNRPHCHTTYIL